MSSAIARSLRACSRRLAGGAAYDIGLQMSLEAMHLVQVQDGAAGTVFRAAASMSYGCGIEELLADPRRFRRLVQRALAEHPFRGRRVVTCMPSHQVKTIFVNYTVGPGQADADVLVRELKARLDARADDAVFDYLPIRQQGADSPRKEALVAIAAKDNVTAYLDLLAVAGLDVAAIDVGPNALARVIWRVTSCAAGEFQNLLLINFGTLGSFVTVFWGRRLMLDRPIEFAERRLLARLEAAMDMSEAMARRLLLERGFVDVADVGAGAWAEMGAALNEVLHAEFMALKAEVAKTLIYTASKTRGKTVDKIYLVGSVARYPGVAELLQRELAMPTEVLDPFSIFPTQPGAEPPRLSPHTGAAVATGLALRGVPSSWPNSI